MAGDAQLAAARKELKSLDEEQSKRVAANDEFNRVKSRQHAKGVVPTPNVGAKAEAAILGVGRESEEIFKGLRDTNIVSAERDKVLKRIKALEDDPINGGTTVRGQTDVKGSRGGSALIPGGISVIPSFSALVG